MLDFEKEKIKATNKREQINVKNASQRERSF